MTFDIRPSFSRVAGLPQQIRGFLRPLFPLATSCLVLALGVVPARGEPSAAKGARRPVALVLTDDERTALVANQRSGSVSIVDVPQRKVRGEVVLGGHLSDLVKRPASRQLLATDEAQHQLLVLEWRDGRLLVRQRLPVDAYPVGVVVSPDGKSCFVASLWSRRITKVAWPAGDEAPAQVVDVIDLTIAPRKQVLIPERGRLIAADSFTGRLAIIDIKTLKQVSQREFPAHNIRGLQVTRDGRMLVIAHQMLNELAHTVRNDVHWGLLMSNDLRWLRLDAVLNEAEDLYEGAHMHPLGEAGNATADPSSVAVASDGKVITTLGGAGEVAIGVERDFSLQRVAVGKRPTAIAVNQAADQALIANTFGDSLSLIGLEQRVSLAEIPLAEATELSEIDQGELLFYDGHLSHDGWMSCHSCHTDGHTNGMLNDNFSDGSFGSPKRVLSLLGRAGTEPLAWNASAAQLTAQVRKSVLQTMQADREPTDKQVKALAAFVLSLKPPPSLDALRGTLDAESVQRGSQVFRQQNCIRCHAPPSYTTPRTYDVNLEDKLGNRRFNPPTLLGLSQRGPYFHDGRAASLTAVLTEHGHPLRRPLKPEELRDLLAFLRSL